MIRFFSDFRAFLLPGALPLLAGALLASSAAAAVDIEGSSRDLEIHGKEANDYFGRPMVVGDFNGDGYGDLVIGADRSDFSGGRRPTLYVFRGSRNFSAPDLIDLSVDNADAIILGETGSDNLATALAVGDVNGDGYPDLVMADSTLTVAGRSGAGCVYVLFGRPNFFTQTTYDLALSHWDVRILGAAAFDDTGGALSFGGLQSEGLACGDLNGDGIADIAIGAHLANSNSRTDSGKVMLVWGRTPFTSGTTIDLASQANVTILGNETYGELGTALAIGDINGDGRPDLIMGEEYGSVGVLTTEGKIFVLFGRASWPATYNLLSTAADVTINGRATWDQLGASVRVGDVNGDGRIDIVATAPGWDPAGTVSTSHGAVYAFFGRATWPATINMSSTTPDFFVASTGAGQAIGKTLEVARVLGSWYPDILFSSRDGGRAGLGGEGRTYIIQGGPGLPASPSLAAGDAHTVINGGIAGFQLGDTTCVGNIDGDGFAEVILSVPFRDSNKGRAFIFDLTPIPASAEGWQHFE